jgi:hypothetical protein
LDHRGPATVFIAVDHFTAECVGVHAAGKGTRFKALEPLRQGSASTSTATARASWPAWRSATTTAASL